MRQLERKIPLMNQKVKATLENFELADGRYSVGLSNYVELQDALANYNNAQLNFVQAVFEYNVARENLLKSMGELQNGYLPTTN
jgi:outer membrane protein TolC